MPQGKVSTYDLSVGTIVEMEDLIHQLDPYDTPMLSTISKGTCFEKKVEWLDETLLTPRSTLAANITDVATSMTVATADANKFGVGDVILIDAEHVRVTAVSADGITLTISRAFAGAAAAHTAPAALVGVGLALAEGSDPEAARTVDRTARFNLTQIFGPHAVHATGTEDVVRKYGLPGGSGEFNYQAGQFAKAVAVSREQALLYGSRVDDAAAEIRTMGGINFFITTNVDAATTTLTAATLLDQLQTCFSAGGNPDTVMAGPKQKRVISSFDRTANGFQTARTDTQRGEIVSQYLSDFGLVNVVLNRWQRVADLFIFERDQAEMVTLRPFQFEMLAKTGDSKKGQMLSEDSFKLHRQSHAAKFSALT